MVSVQLIWNQHEELGRLLLGGSVILMAVWISRLGIRQHTKPA
jgi:hypothetical protein